jgi:tetratricopeptide (TPR) repeat protein
MLHLLDTPRLSRVDGSFADVPSTLPGCLLVYLAAQGDGRGTWIDRESVVALFWPDRPAADGHRNLRVNLHRLRLLLEQWGQADALRTERARLQLSLLTDLAELHAAAAARNAAALVAAVPAWWLRGFRINGFGLFVEWSEQERNRCLRTWSFACEQALLRALVDDQPMHVMALFETWQAAGGTTMPSLCELDPSALSPHARASWQHLRACLNSASASAQTAPARPAPLRALAGRRREQDVLRASSAAAVVVIGEPGAGKTTLLASCWPPAPLLRGREGLAELPFTPILEWLRLHAAALATWLNDPTLALSAYRLDLARLLPELAPNEPLPPLDARTAKARLFEALARVFESRGPLLLVDDLQWCDAATLEWLAFIAHRGRQQWRAAARRDELLGAAGKLLDTMQAANLLELQSLAPLDRDAIGEVCRQRWPLRTWDDALLDSLHRRCAGNPFTLVELIAIGADRSLVRGEEVVLPKRVRDMIERRLQRLSPSARAMVECAAVLARPAPVSLLIEVCVDAQDPADKHDPTSLWHACEEALRAELLRDSGAGVECRHDLIRSAVQAGLGQSRRQWLHRRAALALGTTKENEPLIVALHWEAAQEPQTALAWLHRGAQQEKERGHFDEARALWQRVADESQDATLALRARLALAECDLFHDLAQGRNALREVLAHLDTVADTSQREQIEGQALAGLIDNAVFSGDLPTAMTLARRLRQLLPGLPADLQRHGCEVLIELAMREPDIDAAWALLARIRILAPRHPSILSFEGQIHWFAGNVRAARDAFDALLTLHPNYCGALTIENDLAVMLNAQGELARAEAMARRSLRTWHGIAHTETLSLLVLGSVLTSAGRHDEAAAALDQALRLGRDQSSAMFEAEALVRRARLWLQCGRHERAAHDLNTAEPLLHGSADPLRVSQYAVMRALCQAASGHAPQRELAERLHAIAAHSAHPLLHARLARIEVAIALFAGSAEQAALAAQRQAAIARDAGLLEPLAEALLLQARAATLAHTPDHALPLLLEAAALARRQGFADVAWRAHAGLAALTGDPAHRAATEQALLRLTGGSPAALFIASQAAQADPWVPERGREVGQLAQQAESRG